MTEFTDYDQVPWYRRSGTVNVLVLVGFFGFAPVLWFACGICLSGEIYANERGEDGFLAKCPASTKVASLLAMILQCVGVSYFLFSHLSGTQAN